MNDVASPYGFIWPGKHEAILEAGRPAEKVLRPILEDSVNFATTENIYIEGDNLDALKILLKGYMRRVKMIYIDPPYNTGHDFVYRDDFSVTEEESRRQLEIEDDDGRNYSTGKYDELRRSNPRFHSEWCSMIYPRLRLAQMLLRDDGVMFVSIDDGEQARLRMICDELFGENNFVACLVWKSKSGGANDSKFFAVDHEYILCYAKSADNLTLKQDTEAEVSTSYNRKDDKGEYALDRLDKQSLGYIPALDFDIVDPEGKIYRPRHKDPSHPNARWRWSKDTVAERYSELVFENGNVYTKNYKKAGAIPRSLLTDERFGRTRTGKTDLYAMFQRDIFSSPKPCALITHLLRIATDTDSIILDFFAGSSTTAHAVMSLNAQDSGHRKFIMIQLPEPCTPKSEALKAGYHTISQIGRERIVRSGKWLVDRMKKTGKENANNDSEKLLGIDGVAESNESRQIGIFPCEETPERGTVLTLRPNETGCSVNPLEHSGGASEKLNKGFSALPIDSERLTDGIGDTVASMRGDRLSHGAGNLRDMGDSSGSRENASYPSEDSSRPPLTTIPLPTTHYSLDTGFRAFNVASSNFRDVFRFPNDLTQLDLADMADNIKHDRSDLDLLFMCVTDFGLPLSLPYRSESFGGFNVHIYGDGEIVACFGENISEEAMKHIALMKPKKAVFRDSCFDSVKSRINFEQVFRAYSGGIDMTIL